MPVTLKELGAKEKAEIERILAELTDMVSTITHELFVDQRMIGELDFIFAKARLEIKMNAMIPKLNDNGIIRINKGRHPLLNQKTVVPITVNMGDGFNTLLQQH
jgi:DNA mismatch repair protein MutS2